MLDMIRDRWRERWPRDVVVSHPLDQVRRISDRVGIVLGRGRFVAAGAVEELATQSAGV
jgi:ABC-type sugar transport system ATPase subunit